jgi:hypothetical protein
MRLLLPGLKENFYSNFALSNISSINGRKHMLSSVMQNLKTNIVVRNKEYLK